MLKLSELSHNHHPSGVKMLVNFIRRGIWVIACSYVKEKQFRPAAARIHVYAWEREGISV